MIVRTYEEFADALNETGFLLLGGGETGMLQLSDITEPDAWFSGGEKDPWGWRNILCERNDGAYQRLLDGKMFFISHAWYPSFLAAYRRCDDLEERYEAGLIPAEIHKMYRMFEEKRALAKHELTRVFGRSKAEKGLVFLQREMQITISGEVQKLSAEMKPVGWPSMEFTVVEDRLGAALEASEKLNAGEERKKIRRRAGEISPRADRATLDRLFEDWSE